MCAHGVVNLKVSTAVQLNISQQEALLVVADRRKFLVDGCVWNRLWHAIHVIRVVRNVLADGPLSLARSEDGLMMLRVYLILMCIKSKIGAVNSVEKWSSLQINLAWLKGARTLVLGVVYHLPRTRLFYPTFLRLWPLSRSRARQKQLFVLLLGRRKHQIPRASGIFLSILPLSLRYSRSNYLIVHLFKLLRKIASLFGCRYKTLIDSVHDYSWSWSQAALT